MTHTRSPTGVEIVPAQIIIIEGILIFVEKSLRDLMDVKIYVDTDDDIRFIRRLRRDILERNRTMESVIKQYFETVRPMHIEFVEPSRKFADIVLPEAHNPVAHEMIVSMIRYHLDKT